MNSNYEKHNLKLILNIKEVTIVAEDGSNLTFQIKTGKKC